MAVNIIPERDSDGNVLNTGTAIAVEPNKRVRYVRLPVVDTTPGETESSDWKIPQLSFNQQNVRSIFNGVKYIVEGGNHGDYVKFQIVDVDNIFGFGPGVVLDEFSEIWIAPNEIDTIREYKANLLPGLYVRVVYSNNGTSNGTVRCILLRHIETK